MTKLNASGIQIHNHSRMQPIDVKNRDLFPIRLTRIFALSFVTKCQMLIPICVSLKKVVYRKQLQIAFLLHGCLHLDATIAAEYCVSKISRFHKGCLSMLSTQKNTEIILINSHITTALFAHYLFALLNLSKKSLLSYLMLKTRFDA